MSKHDKTSRPLIGLGIMIIKDGKVLIGKRKKSFGVGSYIFPGGHLEIGESIVEAIKREVAEEAGIKIKNVRFLRVYNLKEYSPKHYVDLSFIADWASGEPKAMEPEKCESWNWYEIERAMKLKPLFAGMKFTFDSYKTGRNFYDA